MGKLRNELFQPLQAITAVSFVAVLAVFRVAWRGVIMEHASLCPGVAVHARGRLVHGTTPMGARCAALGRCARAAQLGGVWRTRVA